jgi:hypothetical protein
MTTASTWPPRKYVKSREMKRRRVQRKEIGEEEGKSSFCFFTAGEEKRSREENDQEQTTYKDRRSPVGPYQDIPSKSPLPDVRWMSDPWEKSAVAIRFSFIASDSFRDLRALVE